LVLGVLSFLLPIGLWCAVSYVPVLWHPQILITEPGSVSYLQPGMRMDRAGFETEVTAAKETHKPVPQGVPANPIYLPSPGQVAGAFYTSFTTAPETRDGAWLHESLWHSIQVIFWGFVISSVIGVPLGVLCGTYGLFARLNEPFIEFFRYLPAPAFGADDRHKLVDNIHKLVDPGVNVEVVLRDEIPCTEAGKFRWVVNECSHAGE